MCGVLPRFGLRRTFIYKELNNIHTHTHSVTMYIIRSALTVIRLSTILHFPASQSAMSMPFLAEAKQSCLLRILIDTNRDPENFLKTNAFYDSKIVGK